MIDTTIVPFAPLQHRDPVIALWASVFGYQAAHNHPDTVIRKKMARNDDLFFVALAEGLVVGTVMAGYDGHRGWIYSLAVSPHYQRKRIGSRLLAHAERALAATGCVKINLQIMEGNEQVAKFYAAVGYTTEKRISMGKCIPENIPSV